MGKKTYQEILRELRIDNDLSQTDVAALLNTTQNTYSRYEMGLRPLPIEHLVTLCKHYGVSSDYVLGLEHQDK